MHFNLQSPAVRKTGDKHANRVCVDKITDLSCKEANGKVKKVSAECGRFENLIAVINPVAKVEGREQDQTDGQPDRQTAGPDG